MGGLRFDDKEVTRAAAEVLRAAGRGDRGQLLVSRRELEDTVVGWLQERGGGGDRLAGLLEDAQTAVWREMGFADSERRRRSARRLFVDAGLWAAQPGVARGEWLGVLYLQDRGIGLVERVVVECLGQPTTDGGSGGNFPEPVLLPPEREGRSTHRFKEGLNAGVAAAWDWLSRHPATRDRIGDSRWKELRVWVGGWGDPVNPDRSRSGDGLDSDVEPEVELEGIGGGSLGLAVGLATLQALVPGWLRGTARLSVVSAACAEEGRLVSIGHIGPKVEGAQRSHRNLPLLCAKHQTALPDSAFDNVIRLGEDSSGDGTFTDAATHAYAFAGTPDQPLLPPEPIHPRRLPPGVWLDRQVEPADGPPMSLLQAVETFHRVDLVGEGGAGKSLQLLDVYRNAYRGRLSEPRVPVWIDLGSSGVPAGVNGFEGLLLGRVRQLVPHVDGRGAPPLIVLLDGVDRLSVADQRRLADLVEIQRAKPGHGADAWIIVARRPQPDLGEMDRALSDWTRTNLLPIDSDAAENYLAMLPGSTMEQSRSLIATVSHREGSLAGNTMILRLLGVLAITRRQLPAHANKGEVYERALAAWLDPEEGFWALPPGWEAWHQDAAETTRVIVQSLAHMTINQSDLGSSRDVAEIITHALEGRGSPTVEEYLDYLRQCPILIWSPRGEATFFHQSVAEHLAARFSISERLHPPIELGWEGVLEHLACLGDAQTVVKRVLTRRSTNWQYRTAWLCAQSALSDAARERVRTAVAAELRRFPIRRRGRIDVGDDYPAHPALLWTDLCVEVLADSGGAVARSLSAHLDRQRRHIVRDVRRMNVARQAASQDRSLHRLLVRERAELIVAGWARWLGRFLYLLHVTGVPAAGAVAAARAIMHVESRIVAAPGAAFLAASGHAESINDDKTVNLVADGVAHAVGDIAELALERLLLDLSADNQWASAVVGALPPPIPPYTHPKLDVLVDMQRWTGSHSPECSASSNLIDRTEGEPIRFEWMPTWNAEVFWHFASSDWQEPSEALGELVTFAQIAVTAATTDDVAKARSLIDRLTDKTSWHHTDVQGFAEWVGEDVEDVLHDPSSKEWQSLVVVQPLDGLPAAASVLGLAEANGSPVRARSERVAGRGESRALYDWWLSVSRHLLDLHERAASSSYSDAFDELFHGSSWGGRTARDPRRVALLLCLREAGLGVSSAPWRLHLLRSFARRLRLPGQWLSWVEALTLLRACFHLDHANQEGADLLLDLLQGGARVERREDAAGLTMELLSDVGSPLLFKLIEKRGWNRLAIGPQSEPLIQVLDYVSWRSRDEASRHEPT